MGCDADSVRGCKAEVAAGRRNVAVDLVLDSGSKPSRSVVEHAESQMYWPRRKKNGGIERSKRTHAERTGVAILESSR